MKNLASDYNALAFEPDSERDPYAKHFIKRAGARNKNLSVQFDPAKHKEWVTGFRARRTERKTAGRKSLEVRAKQERLDDRQQRFEKKKQDLNLPDDYGVGDLDAEEEKKDAEVLRGQKHYADAGVRTVVTTSAIAMNSDDDDSEGSDFEAEDTHTPLGVLAARGGRQNDAAVQEKADQRGSGSKRAASGKFKGNGKPSNAGPNTGPKDKRTSCAERLRNLGAAKERKKSRQTAPRAKQKGGKEKGGKGKGKR